MELKCLKVLMLRILQVLSLLKVIASYQYVVSNAKRRLFGLPKAFYYSAIEPKALGS